MLLFGNKPAVWLCLINSLNSFCNGSILVMLVEMYSLPVSEGGYGLGAMGSGISLSLFGGASFLFQVPVMVSIISFHSKCLCPLIPHLLSLCPTQFMNQAPKTSSSQSLMGNYHQLSLFVVFVVLDDT